MKLWKKIVFGVLALLIVAAIWFYPKYEMLQLSIHLFDEDRIVENFRSFNKVWPVSELKAPVEKHVYPRTSNIDLPLTFEYDGETFSTEQFLKDSWTTGFLVIQNDTIVYEDYYLGNTESTRTISWSVAKSFIATLFGIAIEERHIKNIEETVEVYLPELIGSGYEGVRIKDVLQMSTGVAFNEDYGDFNSDINRWGRGFALGESQDAFAATLENELEPGTVNHYVSINTHVLGMILTKATGRTITDYMQEKIYDPLGMEYDGYWLIDGSKMEMALGGLNLTLRDFAKLGSLYVHEGDWNGSQLVPKSWVAASTIADGAHVQPIDGDFGYGYQWWIPESTEGEYIALGVYNQNIYINPSTNTVIVKVSANPHYNDPSYIPSNDLAALELYRSFR